MSGQPGVVKLNRIGGVPDSAQQQGGQTDPAKPAL
jgi:hypothetical protein